jgi:tripartite-type tricarboxylate transporter receptor subunit TctC
LTGLSLFKNFYVTEGRIDGLDQVEIRDYADANKVLAGPLRKRFEDQGVMITSKTPDQFASHVKAEIAKWTRVVAEAKLEGD